MKKTSKTYKSLDKAEGSGSSKILVSSKTLDEQVKDYQKEVSDEVEEDGN
jgi:hypothetical protein